jgi:putative aldouronate transport system permease protein
MTAYALSKKDLIGRSFFLFMIVFTMMFSGGMIPQFLLVKNMGLMNSLWALILPGAVSAYNMVIMKSFFQSIPEELIESARLDGLSEMGILFKIVMPLSMAALTTIGLFYAVGHWNSFFNALLYLNKSALHPIQVYLRRVLIMSSPEVFAATADVSDALTFIQIKYAVIMVTILPIITLYPFLQRYFVKGVMIGSLKG